MDGETRIPAGVPQATIRVGRRSVALTHLEKVFFPERGLRKRDLLVYYETIAPVLVPHLDDRAMVMKRYPNGITGESFYMKRTPSPHPPWLRTCAIEHGSGSVIDFPVVDDLAALLWIINLGCIDLHPWYALRDDTDRPDALHFDLDPVAGTPFAVVREVALLVHDALTHLGLPNHPKTTGSKGIHIAVPIVRGPLQKEVWTFAKAFACELERQHPDVVTAEYRIEKRPKGRVLIDYNQNAWGRTLASVYSARPRPLATVSTPVTWDEVERGIEIADFDVLTVPARVREVGDLWKPMRAARGRADLSSFISATATKPKRTRKAAAQ